jgi:hypothetical protein
MSVELAIGDSTLHVASEFADAGILSPLTIGDGTHCSATGGIGSGLPRQRTW